MDFMKMLGGAFGWATQLVGLGPIGAAVAAGIAIVGTWLAWRALKVMLAKRADKASQAQAVKDRTEARSENQDLNEQVTGSVKKKNS